MLGKRRSALVLFTLLAIAGCGSAAHTQARASAQASFAEVKTATAGYRNVAWATEAGYQVLDDAKGVICIANTTEGIGTQYIDPARLKDATIDPRHPEGLLYDSMGAGRLRLNGVEYIVDQAKWDAAHVLPPRLFGRWFQLNPAGNRYGVASFYELRAWIWSDNPLGTFNPWNSKVTCASPPRNFN
jgi:hypothetical protein